MVRHTFRVVTPHIRRPAARSLAPGMALAAACMACSSLPNAEQEPNCDLDSSTYPDIIGTVYRVVDSTGAVYLDDARGGINRGPLASDSVTIMVEDGPAVFLRVRDSSLIRADTAVPVPGEVVQVWHTQIVTGTVPPSYEATRLEILRGQDPVPTLPPCDLEAYALPDLIGEVYFVQEPYVLLHGVTVPNLGPYYDSLAFETYNRLAIFLRGLDSSLTRADTAMPRVGERVAAWHVNFEYRTGPPLVPITRLEIFR
jgi:hypothetical protein